MKWYRFYTPYFSYFPTPYFGVFYLQAVLPFMTGVCNAESEKGESDLGGSGDSMETAAAVSQSLRDATPGISRKPG